MKKEKHPVYWAVMAALILLLVLGVSLFAYAVARGKNWIFIPMGTSI